MILHEILRPNSSRIGFVDLHSMVPSSTCAYPGVRLQSPDKQLASWRLKQGYAAAEPLRKTMKQKQLWKMECECGCFNRSGQHFHLRVNVREGLSLWNRFFFSSFLGDSFENSLARKPWALAYRFNKYWYKKQQQKIFSFTNMTNNCPLTNQYLFSYCFLLPFTLAFFNFSFMFCCGLFPW